MSGLTDIEFWVVISTIAADILLCLGVLILILRSPAPIKDCEQGIEMDDTVVEMEDTGVETEDTSVEMEDTGVVFFVQISNESSPEDLLTAGTSEAKLYLYGGKQVCVLLGESKGVNRNPSESRKLLGPMASPFKWVAAGNGEVPANAVQGGHDKGQALYVARAWYDGNLVPGKLHSSHDCCYIPHGNKEHKIFNYEVLVAKPEELKWVASRDGENVDGAIAGGHKSSGELYHIGRCMHDGNIIPGKVQMGNEGCYITYGGKEIKYYSYEVLVSKR